MFNHYKWLSVLLFVLTCLVNGQSRTMIAMKVQDGTITVDGYLDEGVWGVAEKHKVDQVTYGTVDNDADCHAELSTYYDNVGVYVAVRFHDEVHNATNSQYLDAANIAYDDDGWEMFIDYSFDDAISSEITGIGLYGWHLVKGLGNLEPSQQNGGMWGSDDGSGKGWSTANYTVQEQVSNGWNEVFTSDDGLNYNGECLFTWAGQFMRNVGSMGAGEKLGFDIKINDNDGGFGTEGCLTFSGISHLNNPILHWGAIQLGGTAGIAPAMPMKTVSRLRGSGNGSFDLFGRRIAQPRQVAANRILIVRNEQGKAIRSLTR